MGKTARDVMEAPVITLPPDATLEQAASLMVERNIGAVVVTDTDGRLAGILTEGDFTGREEGLPFSMIAMPKVFGRWVDVDTLEAIYAQARSTTVGHQMNPSPVTVPPDAPLETIVSLMLEHDIKRVIVVEDGKPVGIVARRDLLRLMARSPPA